MDTATSLRVPGKGILSISLVRRCQLNGGRYQAKSRGGSATAHPDLARLGLVPIYRGEADAVVFGVEDLVAARVEGWSEVGFSRVRGMRRREGRGKSGSSLRSDLGSRRDDKLRPKSDMKEGLIEVRNDVFQIFDADGEAHQTFGDADALLNFFGHGGVGHERRQGNE